MFDKIKIKSIMGVYNMRPFFKKTGGKNIYLFYGKKTLLEGYIRK